jgi:hypothetical protein
MNAQLHRGVRQRSCWTAASSFRFRERVLEPAAPALPLIPLGGNRDRSAKDSRSDKLRDVPVQGVRAAPAYRPGRFAFPFLFPAIAMALASSIVCCERRFAVNMLTGLDSLERNLPVQMGWGCYDDGLHLV